MKRELLAVGVTACILFSLVAFAQPTAAVLTTVDGPDEVEKPDEITFTTAIDIREGERIPVEGFELVIATDDGETVTVTFEPNGSVRSIDPDGGVVGDGEIRIRTFERTLEIEPHDGSASYGYGERSATDERTEERYSFGYGYGYGYGYGGDASNFAFDVQLDSRAFKHGTYTIRSRVVTGDGAASFASNEKPFAVLLPSGSTPGERPDDDRRDRDEDEEDERHERGHDRWDRDEPRHPWNDRDNRWTFGHHEEWNDHRHSSHDRDVDRKPTWDDDHRGDEDRRDRRTRGHHVQLESLFRHLFDGDWS